MQTIENIQPADAQARLADAADILLLDVREAEEREIAALANSTHIPMSEIPERLSELDPARETIVFCHHGMRSSRVALYLAQNGFGNVRNLAGGIDAWSLSVDSSVPRY